MPQLEGKGAVVTGGSRGIGRAIVERLAADGATVVFSYASNKTAADEVVATVTASGGVAHAVAADFTDPEAPGRLMAAAAELLPGLDILVNNAVMEITPTPLTEVTDELFDTTFTANARAPFQTLRYAAKNMNDDGRVINISTLNTSRPFPGLTTYVSGKGALEQMTNVAAFELGARGITANVVSPGATDTDLLRDTNPPEALELLNTMTPLGRLGLPSDIADVVSFLAGPDSRWITGQNIRATGGLM